jgi:hypothetical protein
MFILDLLWVVLDFLMCGTIGILCSQNTMKATCKRGGKAWQKTCLWCMFLPMFMLCCPIRSNKTSSKIQLFRLWRWQNQSTKPRMETSFAQGLECKGSDGHYKCYMLIGQQETGRHVYCVHPSAHMCVSLFLQTLFTKHKLKGKSITNFKVSTIEN